MRCLPPTVALLAGSAVASITLAGCALPEADGRAEPAPAAVDLTFDYEADGGDGYIDQTLVIANQGGAAGAPTLDIAPLDARGEELPDVGVVTAFGSTEGTQVVPAYTEVIDVLKFTGPGSGDVADVRVDVVDPGTLDVDLPPANDIKVKRFDVDGKADLQNTLGSVLVHNTYDKPITVEVVGFEFAMVADDELQHFRRVSELAGPLELQPGEKVREKVPARYRSRFYGAVRAYLVR